MIGANASRTSEKPEICVKYISANTAFLCNNKKRKDQVIHDQTLWVFSVSAECRAASESVKNPEGITFHGRLIQYRLRYQSQRDILRV
ncbi:hypothetical protein JOB18_015537 [Solea senegalensis]|uniref:Uncharacterized protein n=1 Tax=Solea senegalensis TaxID=28829 RepID=A0AAV6RSV8_SOLSE|nr:hypothetical protein JOB18_015537 [Solea senegalensis]